jgi:choline dehydrogenase-like flavoprotein
MAEKSYDAIVVGSGANGGWAAKELCEAGMQVAVLEAGRQLDPSTDFSEHTLPHELPLRGRQDPRNAAFARRPIGRRNYACEETTVSFFADEVDHPFTFPPKRPFWWIRGNQVGGRTILWGRQSYRMSDWDFKATSRDGFGDDWPISYADVAPYYDKVEQFIGVSGSREGVEVLPDGDFLPPMALSCGEHMLKDVVDGMGRHLFIGRAAVLTRPHAGRAACHYCGPCHRGCLTSSYFSSPTSTLPAAAATGRLTLIPNALAHRVTVDGEARADGVLYFDTTSGEEHRVRAPIVILAASTLASARLLLTSADDRFPNGLANSSGLVGRNLMDHIFAVGADGYLPLRRGAKAELAKRPNGIYIPRFRNVGTRESGFIRGYGYQGGESVTVFEHAYSMPGFGADWKARVKSETAARVSLTGFGEMLARPENRCYLDPEVKDAWGVPVLRIDVQHGDNERAMARDMIEQAVAMLEAAGAEEIATRTELPPPGFAIHEVGTARMGLDPRTSVLDPWLGTHDVKNLFVMDGSCYVSIGCVNPTLTMMALTVRACEHLVSEAKAGNLA